DVFEPVSADRSELAPAELISREERFGVGLEPERCSTSERLAQADAIGRGVVAGAVGGARHLEDRRQFVDDANELRDALGTEPRRLQDPGNAKRRVVDKKSVRALA